MKILSLILASITVVACAVPATAQVVVAPSSTAAGDAMQGAAAKMAAAGYRNLMNSQAYQNITLGNKQAMENRVTHVETYFQTRKLNRQYREAEQMPRLTSEQLFRIAKQAAPQPLRDSQLDPVTGQVEWPIVLQEDTYTAQRDELNKLMAARSSKGGVSPQEYRQIQQTTAQMLATLKDHLRDYKPDDYLQAKNFIESLSYQVQRTTS